MVDTQQMLDRCLEIVNVNGVFNNVIPKIVRFAIDHAFFNTSTSHPDRKSAGVVVAAVIVAGEFPL